MTVRKKQRTIREPIMTRKIKLDKVSKPSQLARAARGSGKMATTRQMIGRRSQATELLMEKEFFLRDIIMTINRTMAATAISSWILIIFPPS